MHRTLKKCQKLKLHSPIISWKNEHKSLQERTVFLILGPTWVKGWIQPTIQNLSAWFSCRQPVAFPHRFLYCSVMQFVCAVYLYLKDSWIWGPLLATHAPLVMAASVCWGRSHESCVVQWNQTLKSWLSGWGWFGLVWDLQCGLKNCTVVHCGEVVSVHFEVNSGAVCFRMWAPFTPLTGSVPLTSLIPKISCGQLSPSSPARHLLLCERLIA